MCFWLTITDTKQDSDAVSRLILPVGTTDSMSEARTALRMAEMRHQGWSTTVYTPGSTALDAPFRAAGIDLRHLPFHGLSDMSTIRALAVHLRGEEPGAAIVAQKYSTAFISLCARKLAGRPDLRVILMSDLRRPPRTTWLARRVYRNLSALLFTSNYSLSLFRKAEIQRGHALIPPERVYVSLHGAGRAPEASAEPKGPVMALYHGELRSGCGLRRLIDAMSTLRGKRIRLMITGKGRSDYMDRLRRRAINRGVMDLISWRSERPSISELAATCHFGIFPYSSEELFGDANVELMAAGRPQILTDGYVAREYLGTDGGAVYLPEDNGDDKSSATNNSDNSQYSPLGAAMLRLAGDADLRAHLGAQAAAAYRRRFDPDVLLDDFASILKGCGLYAAGG